MKCGICEATERVVTSLYGGPDDTIVMRDRYDLARHKERAHPEEVKAQREGMREGRERKVREKQALWERQRKAVAEIDKPVVQTDWKGHVSALTLSRSQTYRSRYPGPDAWRRYEEVVAAIGILQEQAQELLDEAYDQGVEISQEDRQALSAVWKEVS